MPDGMSTERENKMGVMPVGRLLLTMSLPMIISMLIQALYNIVDSMYVAQINEEALTAVSVVFPMQNLMISIAIGTCVGINALLSRYLGEKSYQEANDIARHGIFLAFVSSVIVSIVMLIIAHPYAALTSASKEIRGYAVVYMQICCGVCFGMFMQVMLERILTSTGKTMLTMVSQTIGAVINIILDPILIFGIGPFPEMGIAGAATATVFAQFISAMIALMLNIKKNREVHFNMIGFRPKRETIKNIYKIAIPSIVLTSVTSVTTFGMNMITSNYLHSPTATAVYGVYFKLNSFIFMPVFGMNNGMVPIIAYNYGAKNKERIMHTYRVAVISACLIMLVGTILFWIIPEKLLGIFNASDAMLQIGVPALRIISISFLFAGYAIVTGSVMQALGKAVYSMINSLTRQLVFLLPAAILLAMLAGGLPAIWWSVIIAEGASVVLTTYFFKKVYQTIICNL